MTQNYILNVEPIEQPIYFTIEGDRIIHLLYLMTKPYLFEYGNDTDLNCIKFNIFENRKGDVEVKSNGISFYIKQEHAASELQKLLAKRMILKQNYYFAHGAVVSYRGKGILLLGKSGSGKSTLAAYLCSNGFQYVADDKVILSSETDEVYPFSRFIQLREDVLDILKQYHITLKMQDTCIYEYNRKSVLNILPQEVKRIDLAVFLLRHKDSCECIAQKMLGNDAVQAFLWNSYLANHIYDMIHSAINLARKKPIYLLKYNRMEDAYKFLESVCEQI